MTLWQDILYGLRVLVKKPGFTVVATLSLALGIGANTVIFSLIHTTLLRPLEFPDAGKLMVVWPVPLQHKDQRNSLNVSSYFTFRDQSRSFAAIGAFNGAPHINCSTVKSARRAPWIVSPAFSTSDAGLIAVGISASASPS